MNREAIDTWLERTILALVIGFIAFGTLAFGGVRPFEFTVLWWLLLAALMIWAIRIWLAPKFRFLWPPICWAILPFIVYAIWRWRTADIEFVARQELIQIVLSFLLFLIVLNNLYGQTSVRVIVLTLVFLAMFVAMYGIYQWLRHSDTVWGQLRPLAYLDRASGSFICPNHLAGFLEMCVPIGVALSVVGRMKAITRVCVAYASLVALIGIAATKSRAGWASAALALLILCAFLLRKKGQRWVALLLLVSVVGVGYWLYPRSVSERIAETQVTGHGRDIRLRLWTYAWQLWKQNPWIGVGPDHFDYRFRQYREAVDRTQGRPGRAHNDYINTLADYGVIGLVLVLLPIGIGIGSLIRCWPHLQRSGGDLGQKQSNRAAIVLGASAGLAALMVHSFFDFNMHIPSNAFVATTLLALITTHLRFATERYWVTARWPVAVMSTLIIGVCLFFLLPSAWVRGRQIALLRRAERFPDGSKEKIAALQAAFALEPKDFGTAFAAGEQWRALAWTGGAQSDAQAKEALVWFQKALTLNKWDVDSYIRCGMCLDWIEQHEEAARYFLHALELDPNHWQTRAMMGWHEFQVDHFKEARDWMQKSLQVYWMNNPTAYTYLALSEKMIAQEAARAVQRK